MEKEQKIILEFTMKQYLKLRQIVDEAQDGASSLGKYATPDLQDLQETIKNQQVTGEVSTQSPQQ